MGDIVGCQIEPRERPDVDEAVAGVLKSEVLGFGAVGGGLPDHATDLHAPAFHLQAPTGRGVHERVGDERPELLVADPTGRAPRRTGRRGRGNRG